MRLPRLPIRRPALPAAAADELDVAAGEVLAWAPLVGDGVVALTAEGIRARTPQGAAVRRTWTDVDHLVWHTDSATLAVFWVGRRQPTAMELDGDSYVPEVAHERWRRSVLLTREVPLPNGRGAWLALRRGADGALTVQRNLPAGVRPDAAVTARLDAAATEMLRAAGSAVDLSGGTGGDLPGLRDPG